MRLSLLGTFLIVMMAMTASGETLSIKGVVKGKGGYGISGIIVSASGPVKKDAVTDSKGRFVLSGLSPGKYIVSASKRGYIFERAIVPLDETDASVDIVAVESPKEK